MTKKLKTPSVFALESKLICSDAMMYAGNWSDRTNSHTWPTIQVTEKSVRGTISNRQKASDTKDPIKLDQQAEKANLQTIDNAALPFASDTLNVRFSLRVLGDLATPSVCNEQDYQHALGQVITEYVKQNNGFLQVAGRYATNIANGRFLWRNRVGAQNIEVTVKYKDRVWTFDSESLSLRDFPEPEGDLEALTEVINQGLLGECPTLIEVSAHVQLGSGQMVYPSQELVTEKSESKGSKKGEGEKSKYLYHLGQAAAMHSQKIGNALRTIDTWHLAACETGPIPVESYGSVTSRGKAYRQSQQKQDFYTLLDGWLLDGKTPELTQQHYVMAMFIRGGVFGDSSKNG